jgi:hypothetical protein
VHEDAQVVAGDLEAVAHLVLVVVGDQHGAEDLPISLGQLGQGLLGGGQVLAAGGAGFWVVRGAGLGRVGQGGEAAAAPVELVQNVLTDPVDEGPEALGIVDALLLQRRQDPGEGLLDHVVDLAQAHGRTAAHPDLHPQEGLEVRHEPSLRLRVPAERRRTCSASNFCALTGPGP